MPGGPDADFALRGLETGFGLPSPGPRRSEGGLSAASLPGSFVHEGVPLALASIHAGDWLVRPILVAAIVGNWR